MLPKDLAWVRGKLRFVNAGDEALYQATRFASQFISTWASCSSAWSRSSA